MDPEWVRTRFPALAVDEGPAVAYLDNACTTLKPDVVVKAVMDYYTRFPVCGERSVHRMSNMVSVAVDEGRQALAKATQAQPEDVVFTKNATEAINLVASATDWRPGDVVLTSDKEHNSNFVPWVHLAKTRGVRHIAVPSAPDGGFDESTFHAALDEAGDRLRLASFVHVSNVDGVEFPAARIAKKVHENGGQLMLDVAQSAAHQAVGLARQGADFLALSLHKMMGPSGVGALVAQPEAWQGLGPYQLGGGTVSSSGADGFELLDRPQRYEAGLANYAGLVAVRAGLDFLHGLGFAIAAHDRKLNALATKALSGFEGVTVHGPPASRRSSILPFTIEGFDPHDVALFLDESSDVAVRSGAHCVHSYFQRRGLSGTVRASFHAYNTPEDVERLIEGVRELTAARRAQHVSRKS
jgi:cysteine desulfurase / selenocysteine lyase